MYPLHQKHTVNHYIWKFTVSWHSSSEDKIKWISALLQCKTTTKTADLCKWWRGKGKKRINCANSKGICWSNTFDFCLHYLVFQITFLTPMIKCNQKTHRETDREREREKLHCCCFNSTNFLKSVNQQKLRKVTDVAWKKT